VALPIGQRQRQVYHFIKYHRVRERKREQDAARLAAERHQEKNVGDDTELLDTYGPRRVNGGGPLEKDYPEAGLDPVADQP
jgi:hypothetical protein